MPTRFIKESICSSEQINRLSNFAEITFYRLMVIVDDYGRMDGRIPILKAKLYPLRDIRAKQLEEALQELSSVELVEVYAVDDKPFVRLTGWERHQKPRANSSKFPAPDYACMQMKTSANKCMQMQTNAPDIRNSISDIRNSKAECAREARFSPPTVEDVRAYCAEKGYAVDATTFVDFYASKGWKVGNQPMKDWKASVRTWVKRDKSGNESAPNSRKTKTVIEQQYTQRDYNPAEYEGFTPEEIEECNKYGT